LRQAEALPILARMKARFDEVRPTLRPTAKLAEAIDYVVNRWEAVHQRRKNSNRQQCH